MWPQRTSNDRSPRRESRSYDSLRPQFCLHRGRTAYRSREAAAALLRSGAMPLASLSEATLFYREVGRGDPLIVVHGGLGSDHTYLRAFDRLSDSARLVYFDQRGNGRSPDVLDERITFEALCRDIEELADHLGIGRFAVVGQSFGGYVALELALRCPERLTGLVLVDTAPRQRNAREAEVQVATIVERWPNLRATMDAPWPRDDTEFAQQVDELTPVFFHRYDPERVAPHYRDVAWRVAAMRAGDRMLQRWDVTARLHEIGVPTLVLAGRHDIVIPCQHAETLAQRIPNATVRIFEDSGHNAFIEEPDAFFGTLRRWLARAATKQGTAPHWPTASS